MRVGTVAGTFLGAFTIGLVYGGWSTLYGHNRADGAVGWSAPGLMPSSSSPASTGHPADPAVSAHAHLEPDGAIVIAGVVTGGAAGDRIVVQRGEAGNWIDIPARSTTGRHGRYTVTVRTARPTGKFRVRDQRIGRSSPPLQLWVGF